MRLLAGAGERVAARTMPKVALNELEQMLGFKYNPHGVTQNAALQSVANPIEVATYDWFHSMLQGGTLVVEVESLIAAVGLERETLKTFLADESWQYSQASAVKNRQLHRVFDHRRISSEAPQKVKGSSSEFLGLFGMLRCFVALSVGDDHAMAKNSFDAVCGVIDVILDIKAGVLGIQDGAAKLEAAVRRHLELHLAVYGDDRVIPKHHWMLDVPGQILRDGLLLDAFVVERTHLHVKRVAEHAKNTTNFEKSVPASLLSATSQDKPIGGEQLLGRTAPWPGAPTIQVADRLEVWGTTVACDDVVVNGGQCGIVRACCLDRGDLLVLVQPLSEQMAISQHCATYIVAAASDLVAWPATSVRLTLAWRFRPDGSMLVVRR